MNELETRVSKDGVRGRRSIKMPFGHDELCFQWSDAQGSARGTDIGRISGCGVGRDAEQINPPT